MTERPAIQAAREIINNGETARNDRVMGALTDACRRACETGMPVTADFLLFGMAVVIDPRLPPGSWKMVAPNA